ncbi:hypothetical protein [Klebsiella pneumoniae]|uniref:hypothetical protein n=1 Tax=Klebsiella pneumoniae TaxID=573 RepID=UPI000E2B7E24|nr:hypothetical protein [Klebsiella pneumoniae]SVR90962.1 Uncharacterised protein [Klebsiella pneumoniae]
MTSKFSIDNRELLQRISSGEAVAGIDFGNLIVRELAAFRLSAMDSEPVAIIDQANLDYLRSGADADVWPPEREEMGDVLLYRHPQPAPVVPENYVTAEHRRVIEMLLNVCGAAFELADDSCQQDVDGEDCHVVPDDAFQKLSDALDEIENTLPTEDIDRPDAFLVWSAMPRAALKSILQAGTLTNEDTKQAWTGIPDIDNAINMLDRIDTLESCDDDRIEAVKTVLRGLAGNSPVITDSSADMLRRWLAFGRGMQNAGSQLPHNLIAETESMLAASPQPQNSPQNIPEIIPGWIPVSEQKPDCWCLTCRPVVLNDMRFVVCPDCGNKRCPRANDHRNACTGSNEPGQEGSAYPDTPREVKP